MQYNPHAPYILGNEWTPIRNAFYVPDRVSERGYTVSLDYASIPISGAYYIKEVPSHIVSQACDFIGVYPAGSEDRTGPIKVLYIPASGVALSPNPPYVINISEGYQALNNPTDDLSIVFNPNAEGHSDELWISFNVNAFSQQLMGKRILGLRIRYSAAAFDAAEAAPNMNFSLNQPNLPPFGDQVGFATATEVTQTSEVISYFDATDLNPFWNAAIGPSLQREVYPWRFQELRRFQDGYSPTADALVVQVAWSSFKTTAFLSFLDLEVTYCEETRVLYGGRRTTNVNISGALTDFYAEGPQLIRLRDPNLAVGTTLSAGTYSIVLSHRDMAVNSFVQGSPKVYATRQYYDLPNLKGININQSLVEGEIFTVNEIDDITHLTLHTSSLIVTGVHAYGTSIGAPVYGSITAMQEIEDNPSSGTGVPYPQVRFYARRYADTTVPLQLTDVATGTSTVSISVADFDALPEIVDGWREVTLRFTTPPTFPVTAGDVDWRWSATGEVAGNQWQVLVASGPSVMPGVAFATALATGPATYGAPWAGNSVALTWKSPAISGTAEDFTSDAVLIFSQDPPSVTGFALTVESQAVTGITNYCNVPNDCIPTAISYVRASWAYNSLCDTYGRVVVGSWGTSDSGTATTTSGGSAANFEVNGSEGLLRFSAADQELLTIYNATVRDAIIRGQVRMPLNPTGTGNTEVKIVSRFQDTANFIEARIFRGVNTTVSVNIRQVLAGVETLTSFPTITDITSTTALNFIFYTVGSDLRFKIWKIGDFEPIAWNLTMTTTQLGGGSLKLGGYTGASITNSSSQIYYFDNLSATHPAAEGTYLEVQRYDSITAAWQTIMLSSTPCPHSFSDFEARVGVQSQYRIRTLNALDFAGPWVTGAATIPAPGVTVGGDANSLLIFTSNQSPGASLAYTMQWDGQPIEQFSFPESNTVQLQRMFGKNFFTAFHPLERGGEEFERTLLVNSAAISLPSLANFRGLRDLAWADLNYVCIRDELGNRWFANVRVPSGEVRLDRTIYIAKISVVEVSDTATPVDPADL